MIKNRDGLINSDHWGTPKWLYDKLDNLYQFDFDPCPLHSDFDGLSIEWGKSNFVNPPYNRKDKPKFIEKAFSEWEKGKNVVLLIPSATDTDQSHSLIFKNCKQRITMEEFLNGEFDKTKNVVVFFKGRISFYGINTKGVYTEKNKGKHGSMLVVLNEKIKQ